METGNHDEVLSIRLLNTDSISQAKEKILDLIYKNVPVSDRPRLDNVELGQCILVVAVISSLTPCPLQSCVEAMLVSLSGTKMPLLGRRESGSRSTHSATMA